MKNRSNIESPISRAFSRFMKKLENQGKDNTVRNYEMTLKSYLSFIRDKYQVKCDVLDTGLFHPRLMREFLQYLQEKGMNNNSINTNLANLKAILKGIKNESIEFNELYENASLVRPFKKTASKVQPLDSTIITDILHAPGTDSRIGIKYTTLLALTVTCSLRVSEVISIKIRDLDIDGITPSVMVHGKGQKYRTLPLEPKTLLLIRYYISLFHGRNINPEAFLFYSMKNTMKKLGRSGISKGLKRYALSVSSNLKGVHMHQLRHAGATDLFNVGRMNIPQIALFLGHSSTETTRIYVKTAAFWKKDLANSFRIDFFNQISTKKESKSFIDRLRMEE